MKKEYKLLLNKFTQFGCYFLKEIIVIMKITTTTKMLLIHELLLVGVRFFPSSLMGRMTVKLWLTHILFLLPTSLSP